VDLMLSVDPSPGTDEGRLRAWYAKLGFEQFAAEDPDTLVRYQDRSEEAMKIRAALRKWEAAAQFAHGGTAKAQPLYTAAKFLLAGDEMAKLLKRELEKRKPTTAPAAVFEVGDEP
jgi:hypothetical protein